MVEVVCKRKHSFLSDCKEVVSSGNIENTLKIKSIFHRLSGWVLGLWKVGRKISQKIVHLGLGRLDTCRWRMIKGDLGFCGDW